MQCPECACVLPEDDLFCEGCGHPLTGVAANTGSRGCTCGAAAGETDAEGFCLRCGRRIRDESADHAEQVLSQRFAAVSDRGQKHTTNEDRCGIAERDGVYALVVCDGVSSSRHAEIAAEAAKTAILAALSQVVPGAGGFDPQRRMREAIAAGAASVVAVAQAADENPPSTTVVAALLVGSELTLGWVGDSRAYWIDAGGAHPLTSDHSWMNEAIAAGQVSREEAERSSEAHAITRWLGADAAEHAAPDVVRLRIAGPGTLLLCTDGLWNYAASEDAMTQAVRAALAAGPEALDAARWLVSFANGAGGHDNITAAVLKMGQLDEGQGASTHGD